MKTLRSILVPAVAIVFVAGAIAVFFKFHLPMIRDIRALIEERNELQRRNRAMERELKELKDNQQMFASDPAFVEYTARKENKARPDEIVFIFEK